MPPILLTDLMPEAIAEAFGLKPFQGKQLFRWLHQKRVFDFDAMTDLAKPVRARLKEEALPAQLRVAALQESSASGTKKALFELQDGETVEAVLLRDRERTTLCVSCQVGCPLDCSFCATGRSGFRRDLRPGEIVEQVLHLLEDEDLQGRTPNIVYMGMGEPFLNYDAVAESIRLLMHREGLGIGARKITVSTAGVIPGIKRFTKEDWQVRLAISLHAANDMLRSELVPLNRKYPLRELMAAVRAYATETKRHVSFEWMLLNGVNDGTADAKGLAKLLAGLTCTVNIIPYNAVPALPFEPPSPKACAAFRDALKANGVNATLRKERGQDIDAACGQLRLRQAENSPG